MYNPLSPRQQTERSFIPDDDGTPLFHPWGTIGQAYRIGDPALQEAVTRTFTRWLWIYMLIAGLGFVWAGYAGGRESLLPLLGALVLLLVLMNVQLGRMAKNCARVPNRAFRRRLTDWRNWASSLAIGVYILATLRLGHWLCRLL